MKKKMLAALLALALIIIGIAPSALAFSVAAAGINSFVLPESEEISPEYIAGGQDPGVLAESGEEPPNPLDPDGDGISVSKTAAQDGNGYKITMEAYTTGTVTFTNPTVPVDVVLVLDQSGTMAKGFDGTSAEYANSRQKAMQDAVKNFIDKVHEKYNEVTSDHRVAIVTFGDKVVILNNWTFVNDNGKTTLTTAIDNLPKTLNGHTRTDLGMQKAAELMGEDGYNYSGNNSYRQKVVILFTDGAPKENKNLGDGDFDVDVANAAVIAAKGLKDTGCVVYSIGIFEAANTNELYGDPTKFANSEPNSSDFELASTWAGTTQPTASDKNYHPLWESSYTWTYTNKGGNTITVTVEPLKPYLEAKCSDPQDGDIVGLSYISRDPNLNGSTTGNKLTRYEVFVYRNSQWYRAKESDNGYPMNYHHGGRTGQIGYWWWETFKNDDTAEGRKKRASVPAANRFMNLVSSNYENAEDLGLRDWWPERWKVNSSNNINKKLGFEITANYNRTAPEEKNYYLTADNAAQLSDIFEEVSGEIGSVITTVSLDAQAYIRDVVTPYFNAPADLNDVKLYTAAYSGNNSWADRVDADGLTKTLEDGVLKITGFNYDENCVSEDPKPDTTDDRGKKLIVEFTVTPKPGFLGGNNVPTNGAASGVYDKDNMSVCAFPVPKVNVSIPDISVTVQDKNVYLYDTLTEAQLKTGAAAVTGSGGDPVTIKLDPNAANYGLESWQNEFVTITPTVSPGSFTALTEDKTYTVTVTIAPNDTNGTATEKSASATGNIYVFTPEIIFEDEKVETVAVNLTDNQVGGIVWKHETTESGSVTMIGNAPQLVYSYSIDGNEITDPTACPVSFTGDKYVKVTVKINGNDVTAYVTFKHDTCSIIDDCPLNNPENASSGQFMLHLLNNCTLTVTKQAASGTVFTPGESFIFKITGANDFELEVVLTVGADGTVPSVTIDHLYAGEYTVTEDTGWSWRYTVEGGNSKQVTVTASLGAVTVKNKLTNDKWLTWEAAVDNRWGKNGDGDPVIIPHTKPDPANP